MDVNLGGKCTQTQQDLQRLKSVKLQTVLIQHDDVPLMKLTSWKLASPFFSIPLGEKPGLN